MGDCTRGNFSCACWPLSLSSLETSLNLSWLRWNQFLFRRCLWGLQPKWVSFLGAVPDLGTNRGTHCPRQWIKASGFSPRTLAHQDKSCQDVTLVSAKVRFFSVRTWLRGRGQTASCARIQVLWQEPSQEILLMPAKQHASLNKPFSDCIYGMLCLPSNEPALFKHSSGGSFNLPLPDNILIFHLFHW